jgi:hypothetical protein
MSIKTLALGVVVGAAAFAAPVEAQIWKRGDVVTRSDERVITRTDARTANGASCVSVQLERQRTRRTEQVCDWDRDGVYGDSDDRRMEAQRRSGRTDNGVYRNAGQRRAAEVHARNEARKREHKLMKEREKARRDYEKRQRELEREREKARRENARDRARNGRGGW